MGRKTVVLGMQWGDEGKGKLVDFLSNRHDVVVRFNGGANAGHTVVHEGRTTKFHQIPAGALFNRVLVIANGCMVHPVKLMKEMRLLEENLGRNLRLVISDRAHLVFPAHINLDAAQEEARGASKIGTTLSGNGPAYASKAGRTGYRLGDLIKMDVKAQDNLLKLHMGCTPLEALEYIQSFVFLSPYVRDTSKYLLDVDRIGGSTILLAGAHGVMLDIDHGDYPMVSSSNATLGGAVTGTGLPLRRDTTVIGCVKAYSSRVGGGAMPGEMDPTTMDNLREIGQEYGTTTGRARRLSWLDLQALTHQCKLSGVDELALMKVDSLNGFAEVHVVEQVLGNGEAILTSFPGWPEAVSEVVKDKVVLHPNLMKYLQFIENKTGVTVRYVSYGQEREMILVR